MREVFYNIWYMYESRPVLFWFVLNVIFWFIAVCFIFVGIGIQKDRDSEIIGKLVETVDKLKMQCTSYEKIVENLEEDSITGRNSSERVATNYNVVLGDLTHSEED